MRACVPGHVRAGVCDSACVHVGGNRGTPTARFKLYLNTHIIVRESIQLLIYILRSQIVCTCKVITCANFRKKILRNAVKNKNVRP